MQKLFKRIKPTDPLLTTRWLDVAYSATWLILFVYAIATFLSTLTTFVLAGAPGWYSEIWSFGIGISSLIAGVMAALVFHDGKMLLINKKRFERAALLILGSFNLLYLVLLIVVTIHGNGQLFSQIFRVADFMPLLAFRIFHLHTRIRGMMSLAAKQDSP